MTDTTRPFSFDDLPVNYEGKRIEPASWGPVYSKPPKPGRTVAVDRFPTNCASGQKGDFSAKKHRAKLAAEFTAQANKERANWAAGKPRECGYSLRSGTATTETIHEAYAKAMAEKREQRAR